MDGAGAARQGRAGTGSVSVRRHPERDLRDPPRRGNLRDPHPAARRSSRPRQRGSCASGASSRRWTARTCRMPGPSAVCSDASVLGRPFYLMGFVDGWSPMDDKRWPAPFDTRLRRAPRSGLPAGRGHRAAVEGRLAGEGPHRPWPTRRLPRTPGRALDRVLRPDQGPRAGRHGHRHRVAGAPTGRSISSRA